MYERGNTFIIETINTILFHFGLLMFSKQAVFLFERTKKEKIFKKN